ncbi:MAG: cation:proton antiporter [Clostridia bacterium]|nr:cation:proton antiporter [Clostridia bacterium]
MHTNILFDLGIVLFLGFFAALLMKKLNQSVIIGYMIVGVIIGPNTLGLIRDTETLSSLSELGIVFLMFFLGIEFSLNKFKRIKNSVFFIGTYEIVFNLVLGIGVGTFLRFSMKENLFFAAIIALSSSGVVAKLLFDMRRTASRESEVLMGVMVFEDFFAIVLLGILSSFAAFDKVQLSSVSLSVVKSLVFYSVFILIGVFIINRFIDILTRIDSQELFTTLMIGIILLIGSLASTIGLASAAGAFLFGMVIVSYDVEERLHRTVAAFKDIFLTVFFISFGMLLNPGQIPGILWMIAIVVPISILGEIVITSSSAFFSGFSSKSAIAIGTSMIARGEYSLIYASLGYATGAIPESLYQFTGVYVFVMTLIAPAAMKNSNAIKKAISLVVPGFIKYSTKLISITMKPLLMPEEKNIRMERSYKFIISFSVYLVIVTLAFILKSLYVLLPLSIAGLVLIYLMKTLFLRRVHQLEEQLDYQDLHHGKYSFNRIAAFISNVFAAFLAIILLGASFWNFGYYVLLALTVLFAIYLLAVSMIVYRNSQTLTS